MGSRSGDLDPSVVTYLMEKESLTAKEVNTLLNKESGLLGMSEISQDNRDVLSSMKQGNQQAKLAIKAYTYIIAQYIAKYAVTLNGVDVITFTAGIGERGNYERQLICEQLEFMGVKLDSKRNEVQAEEAQISTDDSKVSVWIVPTNEELMIARETLELIK